MKLTIKDLKTLSNLNGKHTRDTDELIKLKEFEAFYEKNIAKTIAELNKEHKLDNLTQEKYNLKAKEIETEIEIPHAKYFANTLQVQLDVEKLKIAEQQAMLDNVKTSIQDFQEVINKINA